MKCYNHHQSDAVAICKNCNKGVCIECAVDMGNGIACKGACEEEVRSLTELVNRNKKAYKRTGATYYRLSLFLVLAGGFFVYYGLQDAVLTNFVVPVGVIFLIGAGFMIYSGMKFKNK